MKRTVCILLLLFLLTGCNSQQEAGTPAQAASPETEPVQTAPAQEDLPKESEQSQETPAETESEKPLIPALPDSVYCGGDTAVDSKGNVLLQVPDHQLQPLTDQAGQIRGILAKQNGQFTALYDLSGAPIVSNLSATACGCTGDLFWYTSFGSSTTVMKLSDQTVLYDSLADAEPAGDRLVLQPSYWNSTCILVDSYGQTVLELERSFRLVQVHTWQNQTYLCLEAQDGRQSLVDLNGSTCLGFYDQVCSVAHNCAVVQSGSQYLAVSLTSGKTVFQWDNPFMLLGNSVLAEVDVDHTALLDLQGQPLYDQTFSGAYAFDANGDGAADLIFGEYLHDTTDVTAVLKPDGTLLQVLPTALWNVTPINADQVFYTVIGDKGLRDQTGILLTLSDGTQTELTSGSFLQVELIQTSEETLLLCRSDGSGDQRIYRLLRLDGTQVLPDCSQCEYVGSDVFACTVDGKEGLLCLNGAWLYHA